MNLKDLSAFVKSRLGKEQRKNNSNEVAALFKNVSLNDKDFTKGSKPSYADDKAYGNDNLYISPGANSDNAQYYTYHGDDRYLDESGRPQNHLYIAPGEPLTPKNSAKQQIEQDRSVFENQAFFKAQPSGKDSLGRAVITGQSSVPPAPNLDSAAADKAEEVRSYRGAEDGNAASKLNQELKERESEPSNLQDKEALRSADKARSRAIDEALQKEKPYSKQKKFSLPVTIKIFLFLRQLCASFFTYTNLSLVFPRIARKAGPAYPSSMPLTYFAVGIVSSLAAGLMASMVPEVLSGVILLAIVVMFIGISGLRGVGNFVAVFSQRRLDTYSKAAIVFLILTILCCTFEAFRIWLDTDFRFDLVFSSALMLSALTATSINFKENADPEDSYGVLSLIGLCVCTSLVLIVTFLLVNVLLAISMLGIAIFVRVVAGQFMYVNKINAGRDNICGIQYIAMVFLMLDMLIVGSSVGIEGPLFSFFK